jgi:hypothetical protein
MARDKNIWSQTQEWSPESQPNSNAQLSGPAALEHHYTPKELAKLWALSEMSIRRLFANVPGVIKLTFPMGKKRAYVTLRIPESVAIKIHRERSR